MKVYSNDKLIKRNGKLGNIFSIGSLVILGIGFYFSFKDQGTVLYLTLTYACLILGFLLFQVGNYFVNRWGRSPRPDEQLSQALKGLDDKYSLYHFTTGVAHLLVGPAGVIALLPYNQNGTITYDESKNAWRQHGGNFFMKVFGQEGLGRPVSDAKYAKEDLDKYLGKHGAKDYADKTSSLLVFTNEKADIKGEGSPVPYTTTPKLKDYLRRKAKENPINADSIISVINPKE
jgi:hypothetical protein